MNMKGLLKQLTGTLMILLHTIASEVYHFQTGTDTSVIFHQRLNESSSAESVTVKFSLHDEAQPFYKNHHIDESALQTSQHGRFNVSTGRHGENFTLALHIYNIQEEDEGVYVLSVKEINGGHSNTHISDVYIEVILTLGKAECRIRASLYSSHYNEVNCHAALGSDGEGFLVCYQNYQLAPTTGAADRSSDFIRAFFWSRKESSIYCCSFKLYGNINQDSCTDFVYHPPGMHNAIASVTPSETTATDQPFALTSSPDEDEHTSRTNNEYPSIVPEKQRYIFTTFYLVIVCLIISILTIIFWGSVLCLYLWRKKRGNKKHQAKVDVNGECG